MRKYFCFVEFILIMFSVCAMTLKSQQPITVIESMNSNNCRVEFNSNCQQCKRSIKSPPLNQFQVIQGTCKTDCLFTQDPIESVNVANENTFQLELNCKSA